MNISLTKHYEEFVDELLESGQYANKSEVIRAGLRLLENQADLDVKVQAAIDRGLAELDAGKGKPFDAAAIKAEGRRRLAKKQK